MKANLLVKVNRFQKVSQFRKVKVNQFQRVSQLVSRSVRVNPFRKVNH